MLRDRHGLTFMSSSEAAAELIVFPALSKIYNYETVKECFNDRANHRIEWFDLIREDEIKHPGRLTQYIFDNADCYLGMRSMEAFVYQVAKGDVDAIAWVDRSAHLPADESNKLDEANADWIIDNNGSLKDLKKNVDLFVKTLRF